MYKRISAFFCVPANTAAKKGRDPGMCKGWVRPFGKGKA